MQKEPKLTYDIHVHVAGNNYTEWGNYVKPKMLNRFLIKHFIKQLGIKAKKIDDIRDLEKQIANNMKSLISMLQRRPRGKNCQYFTAFESFFSPRDLRFGGSILGPHLGGTRDARKSL